MPTELVLLSDVEPSTESLIRAGAIDHPDGTYLSYRDGEIGQLLDADGVALLQIFASRPVINSREAFAALHFPPDTASLWTDIAIPFGDSDPGRNLAQQIADAVGGSIHERI